jgi:glycine betaine/proline transport system substrate-binding protein
VGASSSEDSHGPSDQTEDVKVQARLLSLLLVLTAAAMAAGCGASAGLGGKGITMGYLGWDENVANSNLLKVILERVDLKLVEVRPAFEGVASGELDAFTDVWMPNHQELVEKVQDETELSKKPWYLGQTEFGIAVPYYMGARSIADLNTSGANTIIGIEPDALLTQRIGAKVIPEYDLKLDLVEASTPAMLSELEQAYTQEEPFVFIAWSPHWMNAEYDFRYLQDPKDAIGNLDQPHDLHSLFREGLQEDYPDAYALINAMKLDEEQINTLELAINEANDPEKGAREWLKSAENRAAVQPWIEAARGS